MGMQMILFQIEQSKLDEVLTSQETLLDIDYKQPEFHHIDIDKSWGVLKFLLEKLNKDLGKLILSGQLLTDVEKIVSDISVEYLTKSQIKDLFPLLSSISFNDLLVFYNPDVMGKEGVYGCPNATFESEIGYYHDKFKELKEFYLLAINNKKATIMFIN